jgi:N-formylglutamate deformylase
MASVVARRRWVVLQENGAAVGGIRARAVGEIGSVSAHRGTASVVEAAFASFTGSDQLVATAIHAGHDLRSVVAAHVAIDDDTRRREEDPFTDLLIRDIDGRLVVHRSRFEVDLNRPRAAAVYVDADDAWGMEVWKRPLPDGERECSRVIHDEFYAALGNCLDELTARGSVLVLDVHSYNHRRDGPTSPPAEIEGNPEINVGTGNLDRDRWGSVVDRFIADLSGERVVDHWLDVRENVRFKGGYLSRWVAERYPTAACTLAIECKKVFMDEWTGVPDLDHINELSRALTTVSRRLASSIDRDRR